MCELIPFTDLAHINPSVNGSLTSMDMDVSFIPMQDVSNSGKWIDKQTRKKSSVINGYTAFQEGDILFAKITPCMENGKGTHAIGLANGIGFGSTEFHVLRAKENAFPEFIFHWCNSIELRTAAEAQMTGSAGQKRVPTNFFSKFKIVRIGIYEQKAIATILGTLDTTIQQTQALIAKLKQVKAGMLHDLLTRGLDDNGELRDPVRHPEQFKDSPLGQIPKDWNLAPLISFATLQRGFDITVAAQNPGNIPVVSSSGISSYHNVAAVEGPGVVIGRKGNLGNSYYIEGPFWPHDTSLWVKNFHGNNEKFVALVLKFLKLERFDAATSVPTLNRNVVHPLLISFPDKFEQINIVKQIETIEEAIQSEEVNLNKYAKLKQALMKDLLTGKVRVPENMMEAMP